MAEEKVPIFVPEAEEEIIAEEPVPAKGIPSFLASYSEDLLDSLKSVFISCSKLYVNLNDLLEELVVLFYVAFLCLILKCVCKIISLKSQRSVGNLSRKKKYQYPLLRS